MNEKLTSVLGASAAVPLILRAWGSCFGEHDVAHCQHDCTRYISCRNACYRHFSFPLCVLWFPFRSTRVSNNNRRRPQSAEMKPSPLLPDQITRCWWWVKGHFCSISARGSAGQAEVWRKPHPLTPRPVPADGAAHSPSCTSARRTMRLWLCDVSSLASALCSCWTEPLVVPFIIVRRQWTEERVAVMTWVPVDCVACCWWIHDGGKC